MKLTIKTSIEIHASAEKIWNILTHFEQFPNWNPFIKSLSGEVAVGNKIKIELPDMNFTPIVQTFDKNKELSWLGHLLFKGLFDGEHIFKIIDLGNGSCTFEHSENFSGILVRPFRKKLETETKEGFIKMNEALKQLAEK